MKTLSLVMLACMVNTAAAAPKISGLLNGIGPAYDTSITRAQLFIKDLPCGVEGYHLTESANDGSYNYHKTRLQKFKQYGAVGFGAAMQHINSSGDTFLQAGPGVRFETSRNDICARADIRYFPHKRQLNSYAFVDTKRFFADVETNFRDDTLKFNPGVDYKLGRHLLIGVEALCTGPVKRMEKTYVGLRLGVQF